MTTEVFRSGPMSAGPALTAPDGFPAAAVHPGAVYPAAAAPPARTLWQVLEATAERFPRAAAIDDGKIVLDYASFLRWVAAGQVVEHAKLRILLLGSASRS